ncbi:MAG: recombinase family protein [Defluviitaleaceae bacterium]|nr:recombinase family protein [Defluviitaleaceae bacterium]
MKVISIYGYCRVSTAEQNENRQLDLMATLKIPRKQIFLDKQSGKNTARPGLQKLLATVKRGDTVIVESVSRFARNTRDLLALIDRLTTKGVEFVSQKEKIDTTTPTGQFILTVFGAVSELERCHILQRQAEGIASAKARGVKFGRPIKKPPENFAQVVREWERGKMTFGEALSQTGLKQATFYNRLREIRSGK